MGDKKPQRILVVDDDHECRLLLSTFAAQAGYEVDAVADGSMALTLIASKLPDLVLLDVNLPKRDGFEVCRAIRESKRTEHLPVIMLTAFSTTDARERGLEVGADEFVAKPFRAGELLEVIDQLLKIREARKQLEVDPRHVATTFSGGSRS
jgi:DNA-binding response OmpR family regulator